MKFFLALVAGFIPAVQLFSKEIRVCVTCEYRDLKLAVQAAGSGDVITLARGVHSAENLRIEKKLSLRGEPGAIVDGGGKTIFYVAHDSVSFSDLELRNVETNYVEDRAAIKGNSAHYIQVRNVSINNSFFGILLEKSRFGVIENCTVAGTANLESYVESANGNAIHLWYCKNMTIRGNRVSKHRDGIYFEFVEDSAIEGNWSEGNVRYGLHFMFSHRNTYTKNTFFKNGAGVAVMYSTNVTMIGNRFLHSWGESAYGLLLKDITDSELYDNLFFNNTFGISADNAMRVNIHDNVFNRNGYAMRIYGNCGQNEITRNDFFENTFDVTTNSLSNYNTFDGNYWEEYTGYDLNRDGVGDVPFRPVKLFTYITTQAPASVILLRSTFIDLLNLAEKVTPVLTPETLTDNKPMMRPINDRSKATF